MIRRFALALLAAVSVARDLPAVCSSSRSPERDLWIEVVSCSDQVLQEVSDELFVQALGRTGGDWTRFAVPRAKELLRATPEVLIVAREVAFADSTRPFTKRTPGGESKTVYSDRPGDWQGAGTQPEGCFFLGSAEATCEALIGGGRIVVREVSRCCDTGRGPELGCILRVSELVPSLKAPPTADEISDVSVAPAASSAEPAAPAGVPGPS